MKRPFSSLELFYCSLNIDVYSIVGNITIIRPTYLFKTLLAYFLLVIYLDTDETKNSQHRKMNSVRKEA